MLRRLLHLGRNAGRTGPAGLCPCGRRRLRLRRRRTGRALDGSRCAERERVRLEHRPPARDDSRRPATASPIPRPETSGSTAACSAPAASHGRRSWTSTRTRSTSRCSTRRAAQCSRRSSERAPGATSPKACHTERTAASGSHPWSRGVLAVEGQFLPARLTHRRVGIDAGSRVPQSAFVARRQADGAQVQPLERSSGDQALPKRCRNGLRAGVGFELGHRLPHVGAHSLR